MSTKQLDGWDWQRMAPTISYPMAHESVAVDTGLLDANGNKLMRGPTPVGFDLRRVEPSKPPVRRKRK